MKDLAKQWRFWACVVAALVLGVAGRSAIDSDEVSASEIQAMSLNEYRTLVARRDQITRTIEKFRVVWDEQLRTTGNPADGGPVTRQ